MLVIIDRAPEKSEDRSFRCITPNKYAALANAWIGGAYPGAGAEVMIRVSIRKKIIITGSTQRGR